MQVRLPGSLDPPCRRAPVRPAVTSKSRDCHNVVLFPGTGLRSLSPVIRPTLICSSRTDRADTSAPTSSAVLGPVSRAPARSSSRSIASFRPWVSRVEEPLAFGGRRAGRVAKDAVAANRAHAPLAQRGHDLADRPGVTALGEAQPHVVGGQREHDRGLEPPGVRVACWPPGVRVAFRPPGVRVACWPPGVRVAFRQPGVPGERGPALVVQPARRPPRPRRRSRRAR